MRSTHYLNDDNLGILKKGLNIFNEWSNITTRKSEESSDSFLTRLHHSAFELQHVTQRCVEAIESLETFDLSDAPWEVDVKISWNV